MKTKNSKTVYYSLKTVPRNFWVNITYLSSVTHACAGTISMVFPVATGAIDGYTTHICLTNETEGGLHKAYKRNLNIAVKSRKHLCQNSYPLFHTEEIVRYFLLWYFIFKYMNSCIIHNYEISVYSLSDSSISMGEWRWRAALTWNHIIPRPFGYRGYNPISGQPNTVKMNYPYMSTGSFTSEQGRKP